MRRRVFPFQSPKGMHDILPADFLYIERVERALAKVAHFYGFERIETPVLEDVRLFERGTGPTSEIVTKQMYVVKGKRDTGVLALRPEMTPGVFRAYIQHGLSRLMMPGKLYYNGPAFRHERSQAGRFRQFQQVGFEVLGTGDPAYDAQVIMASWRLLSELKLKNVTVRVNSIGCGLCRPVYVRRLKEYYKKKISGACRTCQKRFKENPLRLLDCKEPKCQPLKEEAPVSLDSLCSTCKNHFTAVLELLEGTGAPYLVDQFLVRGLDYYSRTVFELFAEGIDAALGGGGRYDYLSEALSGPRMGAVGVALGVERIVEAQKTQSTVVLARSTPDVFVIYMGDEAKKKSFALIEEFYKEGLVARESFSRESLKSQLRAADKEKTRLALILGQREVFEEVIIVRDMRTGNQETVSLKKVVETVKKRLH